MSNTAMCRICLAMDVKLYSMLNTPLQEIYEKITNISLSPTKESLNLACYICRSHLKRCHQLMMKALDAEQILTDLLQSGIKLNYPTIDNKTYKLSNDYCISPIEHFSTIHIETLDVAKTNELEVKAELFVKNEEDGDVKRQADYDDEQTLDEVKWDERYDIGEESIEDVKIQVEKYEDADVESDHEVDASRLSGTDSDDDVPLYTICNKNKKITKTLSAKTRKWVRKKEKRSTEDFAKEIILTKEQQLQELETRAKSLNYLNSPLKCTLCYKGFVDSRAYENHVRKHDEKSGPHVCEICHMRYSTHRQLRTHSHTSHTRRYQCNQCSHQSHTASQARDHEKWHKGYTYECKLCGQTFRKPTSYLTHTRKRHPTQHACDICGDSFVGQRGLLMHKTKTHKDHKMQENLSEPESARYCAECDVQFASVDAWQRHILSCARHTLAGNEVSPECKICGAKFPSASSLAPHLREHERSLRAARSVPLTCKPTAELTCDQCDSMFVSRAKLQAHVKRKHLGLKYNKNIVCEVCGKKCTSNASLKYHQRTHTGERPHPCNVCSKWFTDKNQLRIHTRTHTGERPYCCSVCGKRFSQKPALNRHYRVHTGVKPYICQYCSKPFSQSNSLTLHVRTVHLKLPVNRRNKQTDTSKLEEKDSQPTTT